MKHVSITVSLATLLSVIPAIGVGLGFQGTPEKPEPYAVTLPNSVVKLDMVPVPEGTVEIDGKPVKVKPFFMATTETTWEAFDVFLASGPPSKPYDQTQYGVDAVARPSRSYILPDLGWGHRGYPAMNLSFASVEMYCRWLSSVTGKKYRVPTEAEWELAARGGTSGAWKLTKEETEKVSWNVSNSDEVTHPVGKKSANKYGLFDLLGNVGEWATDLNGQPVLCGPTFWDAPEKVSPTERKRWEPAWQLTDPQMPKSRWWLSDGPFAGFRIVREP